MLECFFGGGVVERDDNVFVLNGWMVGWLDG